MGRGRRRRIRDPRRGTRGLAGARGPSRPCAPFRIVGAHTDSPNLRLKPRPDTGSAGWRRLAIEVYGGALVNSWLDRDLGLSGRLVLDDGRILLVQVDQPLARVPQLAIHLDRDVNERGLALDKQLHLTPVWGSARRSGSWRIPGKRRCPTSNRRASPPGI